MSGHELARQSTDLGVPDADELGHIMQVVRSVAQTDFVPKNLRGNNAAILACILAGREMGLGPMHALRAIHIIDGRPSASAEVMVALARKRGHSIEGALGDGTVTVTGIRGDNGNTMSVTWTREMAQRAGLLGKDNWKKYPESMLWARAVSQLCRMLFPDVLGGVSYTPEEAELASDERAAAATADLPLPAESSGEGPQAVEATGAPEQTVSQSAAAAEAASSPDEPLEGDVIEDSLFQIPAAKPDPETGA